MHLSRKCHFSNKKNLHLELPGFTVRFEGRPLNFGNGPNTVSESTVSDTELSEFFEAH